MRFLRMRPAVWAMISCSFSSFTRKVAFGSSSVTTPGNSKSSSFGIRVQLSGKIGAEATGMNEFSQLPTRPRPARRRRSLIGARARDESLANLSHQLIAHRAIGVEALLAIALDRGRIGCRPILDLDGKRARELERLVMRFGGERDDQIEIETFEVLELLERD